MQIGEQIRAAREAAGMDQGQLAEAVGAARETVSRWETGARTISRRSLIAVRAVLGMGTVPAKRERRKAAKS